jgi:hypothetical protein
MPRSAWALGWLCLADQVLQLQHRGLSRSDPIWVLLSVALTAIVVVWFSVGVLQARRVRLVVVWILLCLALLLRVIGTLTDLDGRALIELLVSIGQVVALGVFCSTPYFRERTHPPSRDLAGVLVLAFVVGVVGGITAPADGSDQPVQLRIGL